MSHSTPTIQAVTVDELRAALSVLVVRHGDAG